MAAWVVERPRLVSLIQECFDTYDVVEIAAAPGSGKSVAAQQYAARYGTRSAWLNLDSADRSAGRLVVYLAEALATLEPTAPKIVDDALRSGLTPLEAAAVLSEAMGSGDVLLVLDNCEEVNGDADALAVIATLLTYLPARARVLLLARDPLTTVTARMALDGRAARLGDGDLAFGVDEARSLLAAAGQPESDASELIRATGGWAAGLIFGTNVSDRLTAGNFADYLNEEILNRIDADERDLLLRTSMLTAVTASSAKAVCGPTGPAILARLVHRRLPAIVGSEGELVCHPFFRQFLQARLAELMPEESADLRRKHGQALAANGDYEDAATALIDAGALADAATAAEQALGTLYDRGDWQLVRTWLDQLGDDVVNARPILLGGKIRALTHTRSVPQAQSLIRTLHRDGTLAAIVDADPAVVAHVAWAFTWRPADGLRITGSYPLDHRAEAVRYVLRVTSGSQAVAPPPGFDFGDVERIFAWGLFLQGRLDALAKVFPDIDSLPRHAVYRTPLPLLGLVWNGKLNEVHGIWDQVPVNYPDMAHNLEAWILIADGDYEGALRAGQESVGQSQRTRYGWEPYLQLVLGLAYLRLGHVDDGRAVLTDASNRSAALGQEAYAEWAETYLGLADLINGANEAAVMRLRRAVETMTTAGRRLMVPAALAYLSEAEARCGAAERAAELAEAAHRASEADGTVFPLQQALLDVPGVADRLRRRPSVASDSGSESTSTTRAGASSITSPTTIEVRPFGPRPDIWVNGVACGVRRLKVIELAAYLALHGGKAVRQQVQLDLFPEHDQRTGSNYFRQIAHQFRRATDVPLVRRDSYAVGLPEGVTLTSTDVQLEQIATHGLTEDLLGEALDVVAGSEGVYLAASSLAWADARRYELTVLETAVLRDGAGLAMDLGRLEIAEQLAKRTLRDDPYCEEAYRVLFAVADRMGSPERQAIVYQRAKNALAEIDLKPEDIGLIRK